MAAVATQLSEAQHGVVEWLKELPRSSRIEIRTFQTTKRTPEGEVRFGGPRIEIRGGSNEPERLYCNNCERALYYPHVGITFYWERGRFLRAEVNRGGGGRYRRTPIVSGKAQFMALLADVDKRHAAKKAEPDE